MFCQIFFGRFTFFRKNGNIKDFRVPFIQLLCEFSYFCLSRHDGRHHNTIFFLNKSGYLYNAAKSYPHSFALFIYRKRGFMKKCLNTLVFGIFKEWIAL